MISAFSSSFFHIEEVLRIWRGAISLQLLSLRRCCHSLYTNYS